MLKLAKANAAPETDTALTTNEYTREFTSHFCRTGMIVVSFAGTFGGATLTLEVSYDGANFVTYAAEKDGSVANVTFTEVQNFCIYGPSQVFRFHCTGGSGTDIDIFVSGDVSLM